MLRLAERIEIPGPADAFLPWFAPHSPVGLFNRWGPIPGVAAVINQTGEWTVPGSKRTLRLSDGAQITEEVLAFAPTGPFRYRMSGFAGVMGALVHAIEGEWRVEGQDGKRCRVFWAYCFRDRGALARVALWLMAPAWRGYMRASLRNVARAYLNP